MARPQFSKKFVYSQIVFVTAMLLLGFMYVRQKQGPDLPVYDTVRDFQLQNQDGKTVTMADLKGNVWIANFMFTTCSGICPMMTGRMAKMDKMFERVKDMRLVSISVNPENDTPQALKAYAEKFKASNKWIFLTGPHDTIQSLAVDSFKIGDTKELAFHSQLFVLVDRTGQIRGYYDSTDEERMARLIADLPLARR